MRTTSFTQGGTMKKAKTVADLAKCDVKPRSYLPCFFTGDGSLAISARLNFTSGGTQLGFGTRLKTAAFAYFLNASVCSARRHCRASRTDTRRKRRMAP